MNPRYGILEYHTAFCIHTQSFECLQVYLRMRFPVANILFSYDHFKYSLQLQFFQSHPDVSRRGRSSQGQGVTCFFRGIKKGK